MNAQPLGAASFYYYTLDSTSEKQRGHFTQQQPAGPKHQPQQQLNMYPIVPTLPSTPIYSRPNSACSQQQQQHHHQPQPQMANRMLNAALMTPVNSPRPLVPRPGMLVQQHGHQQKLMVETDVADDGFYYPATPPLSSSASVISSPNSCDALATPMNPMFSGLDGCFEGANGKVETAEVAEPVTMEQTIALEWATGCASPPMTPVYLQAPAKVAKAVPASATLPSNSTINGDLLSNVTSTSSQSSCPSLSSSPSPPYAQSVASEQDIDFCDPRNLTVAAANSGANPTLSPEFTEFASLASNDEAGKFSFLSTEPFPKLPTHGLITPDSSFNFGPACFDEFSDLDSEVDCFVNLGTEQQQVPSLVSRSRASSSLSLGEESFICDEDYDSLSAADLPTPPTSEEDSDVHADKRQKRSKTEATRIRSATMNAGDEAATESHEIAESAESQEPSGSTQNGGSSDGAKEASSENGSEATGTAAGTPTTPAAPVPHQGNRRGRKQSLTEDPTKTFVCDLCNRRFRRQEHLKRHYRSLHTMEKPFECHECGKKFSRSDNLAQHARTHGSGAIVMNILDDAEVAAMAAAGMDPAAMMMDPAAAAHHHAVMMAAASGAPMHHPGADLYANYGKVLFQVAADLPGSASELSSEEGSSPSNGKKKRKRTE